MTDEELEEDILRRVGGESVLFWVCRRRNPESGGVEYRFQTVPFSHADLLTLELPPTSVWWYGKRYAEESFADRFSCCLRDIRGPLADITLLLDEPEVEEIGRASVCAELHQKLSALPAAVV